MDNIEKLIQMATIEQMYNMLNKMKENVVQPVEGGVELNNELISLKKTINELKDQLYDFADLIKHQSTDIHLLTSKVSKLELTLLETRQRSVIELDLEEPFVYQNKPIEIKCEKIEEPVVKTFVEPVLEVEVEEQHIKLNVEEKELEQDEALELEQDEELELELEQKQEEKELEQDEELELEQKQEEKELEQDEENQEVSEEELEEEEVVSDEEEVVSDEEEVVSEDIKEEVKQEVKEEENVEDDEEVFEIEIDDISYFATDDENGILYEMTEDKDIGKKVGIIKNGEPIFD